jgi:hypothetical protein
MGTTFTDVFWGKNYKTDKEFSISQEVLEGIQEKIKETL